MDFFGMGIGEILLILVIALIVLGPERIVKVGTTMGKAARTLRKMSSDLTTQMSRELEGKDTSSRPGTTHGAETKKPVDADEA